MFSRPTAAFALGGSALVAGGIWYWNQVSQDKKKPIFVINGFYMSMREKYTKPDARIHYYLVEWEQARLSWEKFRGEVLGGTDPVTAAPGSLRRVIYEDWQKLGLAYQPNVGDNGVHASASPFEALAERLNWVDADIATDEYAQAMLKAGIPKQTIMDWTKDPQVPFEGKKTSLFDLLEDLDASNCLKKAQSIAQSNGPVTVSKNQAFVFIKPHAVTDKTKTLTKDFLASKGLKVVSEGSIDGPTIEKNLLIDNHYYAIAQKSSLSKPHELNPPQAKRDDFKAKFGISWEDALKEGQVFNAVDGCKHLGVDGEEMNRLWAATKASDMLVKFGGGFYAGKVDPTV